MKIETLSVFPQSYDSIMNESMMRIAQEKGALEFVAHDLRDWTHDKHRTTDDEPYGGGQGLVMKCEPIFEATDELFAMAPEKPYVIFMSPTGRVLDEALALELAHKKHLFFICGHYEGIDERAYALADEVISIGDYVLTSGELASMVVIDAVVRRLDGVLGDEASAVDESFTDGLLEYPQYTRPASFRGMEVPEVLLSGHHANIAKWRHEQSLLRTQAWRPDLLEKASLSDADEKFLRTCRENNYS
ncbi:MAG: tRNA (guanosine(37)-N1)-methyltransferase TrmD [Eggerthellaceae bacterium]